ncbi:MAG: phosphatidylglycerol lysyltransferase domain-containing protein [Knoellia sp.]
MGSAPGRGHPAAGMDDRLTPSQTCPSVLSVVVPTGGVLVAVSDLHLPPRATEISTRTTDALSERLAAAPVHTVVLAGDILELLGFPDTGPGQILDAHPRFVDALGAVLDAGGQVVYVVGNHDGDLAWDEDATRQVLTRLEVRLCLAAEILFEGKPQDTPHRVWVEHGHQLDPLNSFVDQRNPLDSPLGHHVVRQVLPQVEAVGAGWLKDTHELADASGFPSYVASRLTYRRMGRHLWWLLLPLAILALRTPELVELLSGHATAAAWSRRAQAVAVGALLDLALVVVVVAFVLRRTWHTLSSLGLGERGSGQNVAARQRALQLVNAGYSGMISGHTHRAELHSVRTGFYANTGSGTAVVEAVRARFGLPPAYLRAHQVSWVECVFTQRLEARLALGRQALPGANWLERLATIRRRPHEHAVGVVATWPDGAPEKGELRPQSTNLAATSSTTPDVAVPARTRVPAAGPAAARKAPNAGATTPDVTARWSSPGRFAPTALGWLLLIFGVATLVSALVPRSRERLNDLALFVPEPASAAATAATAALGLLLGYLAHGLRRRKARAWRVAVAATALLLAVQVFDRRILHALLAVVVLGVLVLARREFYALGDPATNRRAIRVFLVLLAVALASGMLLIRLYRRDVLGQPSWVDQMQHLVLGLIGVSGPVSFTTDRADDVVSFTLIAFGLLIAFITAYLVLRPADSSVASTDEDQKRLRALLATQGHRDSLGYFALRHDKVLAWSPSGKAAVAYRVIGGVALASGDPLGDPEAWPGALDVFLERARTHAWVPAVLGCSEAGGKAWRRAGLDALELGDEAVLDVGRFSLQGRPMRNVRQAAGRAVRAGYVVRVRRMSEIPDDELAQLSSAVGRWRGAGRERGFSMALSRFAQREDDECVVVSAHLAGRVMGVLNFVPWGIGGLSLDLMTRDREADNGTNEFLITELVAAAPALGVTQVSLNFAVFRSTLERGERLGAGPVTRVWSKLLVWASQWWQIDSLYHFNAKFAPDWYPRYVCFPSGKDLPRIAVAALEAEAFLALPRPGLRWLRGARARDEKLRT